MIDVIRLQNALEDPSLSPPADATFKYGAHRGRGYMHAWSGDDENSMRVGDLVVVVVAAAVEVQ